MMIKKLLWVVIFIAGLLIASCYDLQPATSRILRGDAYLSVRGQDFLVFPTERVYGIEVSFAEHLHPSSIVVNPDLTSVMNRVDREGQTRTVVALVSKGLRIEKGTLLFSVPRKLVDHTKIQTTALRTPAQSLRESGRSNPLPELLGDFDNSGRVDETDLRLFQSRYGTSSGKEGYDIIYDIGPAVNLHGGPWVEIVDTPDPDGVIDLEDLYVLNLNWGKTRPGGARPIHFDMQPQDQSVLVGNAARLEVRVSGGLPPYTYTWSKNGVRAPNQTNAIWSIPNASSADAGDYRVEIQDRSNPPQVVRSQIARLSVVPLLSIRVQPGPQNLREGEILNIQVEAVGGTQPYSYRWFKDEQLIPQEQNRNLVRLPVTTQDQGTYRVEITDSSDPVQRQTSNAVPVSVSGLFRIIQHPQNQDVEEGEDVEFQVLVEGGKAPYIYRWRKNGIDLLEEDGSSLELFDVKSSDSGRYSVIITDRSTPPMSLNSNDARLRVNPVPEYLLRLNRNPEAGGTVSGGGKFAEGTENVITATPNQGYRFVNWTEKGKEVSSQPIHTFLMPGENVTLVANFTQSAPKTYSLTLSATPIESGSVEGSGSYSPGADIPIFATPIGGYQFVRWTRDDIDWSSPHASLTYTMPAMDVKLIARFDKTPPLTYHLTLSASPAGSGIVDGSGAYSSGADIPIFATPIGEYQFVHWTRDDIDWSSPHASLTYTMPAMDVKLIARFDKTPPLTYHLTLSATPAVGGTASGTGMYLPGASVPIEATPSPGYQFVRWTRNGEEIGYQATRTFIMPAEDTQVVAHFEIPVPSYDLTLTASPTDGGVVLGSGRYPAGTDVEITATPNLGHRFIRWTRDGIEISVKADPTYRMLAENTTLVAHFEKIPIPTSKLTMEASPTGAGTVTGAGEYAAGDEVEITASANFEGYRFIHWTKNGAITSTEAAHLYTMPSTHTHLVAHFELEPDLYLLTLEASPAYAGQVEGGRTYAPGAVASVLATAYPGYLFKNWTRNGAVISTNAAYTITMPAINVTFVANFEPSVTYPLTLVVSPLDGGTVEGGGDYVAGASFEISADPKPMYAFENWTRNGHVISTQPTHQYTMPATETTVVANFVRTYTLFVIRNDVSLGIVSASGVFKAEEMITLQATPTGNNDFVRWVVDGSEITENPYNYQMPSSDTIIMAIFKPLYTLTLNPNDPERGTVSGGGSYRAGQEVTIQATPAPGYRLVNWTENGVVISAETYRMPEADTTLVANFDAILAGNWKLEMTICVDGLGEIPVQIPIVIPQGEMDFKFEVIDIPLPDFIPFGMTIHSLEIEGKLDPVTMVVDFEVTARVSLEDPKVENLELKFGYQGILVSPDEMTFETEIDLFVPIRIKGKITRDF